MDANSLFVVQGPRGSVYLPYSKVRDALGMDDAGIARQMGEPQLEKQHSSEKQS